MASSRKKRSPIWRLPKDELITLLEKSDTFTEVLAFFGLRNVGSNFRTLTNRLKEENIDYSKFKQNKHRGTILSNRERTFDNSDVFVENSSYARCHLKDRIINQKLIDYVCNKCGLSSSWQNERLSLVLDHINGISNDNRIENLRFLCPNCNSQTSTFAGKKLKKGV